MSPIPTTAALVQLQIAQTGSVPVLFAAADRRGYWAKWPENPHGNQSLLHELVVARLGAVLDAPVPGCALIDVNPHLIGDLRVNGVRPPAGTWFGLRVVGGIETQEVRANFHGNRYRLARYLALWDLCMGDDAQFMYDVDNGNRMWSIDHGLWFDGSDGPWKAEQLPTMLHMAWADPPWRGSRRLDPEDLVEAARSIASLRRSDITRILVDVPLQWGIPRGDLEALEAFIFERRLLVADRLRVRSATETRRTRSRGGGQR